MSELAETSNTEESSSDAAPAQETTVQTTARDKPPGYDPVDLDDLPEDKKRAVSDRFSYLYGQVKGNERTLNDFRNIAAEQARQIEELTKGFGAVAEHLHTQEFAETEAELLTQMKDAHETGDTAAYIAAQDKLLDLKAEKKLQEREKKNAPAPKKDENNNTQNQPAITPDESRVLESWQQERDANGELIRPWAFDRSGNGTDPEYITALQEANVIFNSPKYKHLSIEKKLEMMDVRQGVKKSTSSQNVMGGGFTTNNRGAKVIMTDKQKEIAIRTKYGGSKAKTDAEHIEAYRKQIEKVKLSKGAR